MEKSDSTTKIILFTSTILALFITASGFLTVKDAGSIIFQVIFLPITLYLLASSIDLITHGSTEVSFAGKKVSLVIFAVIFLVLFGVQAVRILGKTNSNSGENNSPKMIFKTESSASPSSSNK